MRVVECVPNISEGRRPEVYEAATPAAVEAGVASTGAAEAVAARAVGATGSGGAAGTGEAWASVRDAAPNARSVSAARSVFRPLDIPISPWP